MKMPNTKTIKLIALLIIAILIWYFSPYLKLGSWSPFTGFFLRSILFIGVLGGGIIKIFSWNSVKQLLKIGSVKAWMITKLSAEKKNNINKKQLKEFKNHVAKKANKVFSSLKLIVKANQKRKRYLKSIPWYVFLGQQGGGKNSAISALELDTKYGEKLHMEEIYENLHDDDNCKWWFTKNALLLSVDHPKVEANSGETLNQVSERGLWLGMLKLLSKYRRRRPINAVIITIGIEELITQDTVQSQARSQLIRHYINDLHRKFGIRVPVYVVFTKCDLIGGFVEYFNDLTKEDREQLWGVTFPLDHPTSARSVAEYLDIEFERIVSRLNERLLWRMASEHEPKRRELISYFPQQLHLLKNIINKFITQTFASGDETEDERIHLRGFYLTSAMQHGRPRDILMTIMADKLSLDNRPLEEQLVNTHGYFLRGLFQDLIYPEKDLVGSAPKTIVRKNRFTYIVAPLVMLLGISGIWSGYNHSKIAISQAEEQLQHYYQLNNMLSTKDQSLTAPLPSLVALRNIPKAYSSIPGSWLLHFGIYLPHSVSNSTQTALARTLQLEFMPRLRFFIENLLQNDKDNPYLLYNTLKAYLALNLTDKIKAFWITPPVSSAITAQYSNNPDQEKLLQEFLSSAVSDKIIPQQLNYNIIANSRAILKQTLTAQRAYWLIKQKALHDNDSELDLQKELGSNFGEVFTASNNSFAIPYIFTKDDFERVYAEANEKTVTQIAKSDYVLGLNNNQLTDNQKLQITDSIHQLYLSDYGDHWQSLIDYLQVTKLANVYQAATVTKILSSGNSPLPSLLTLIKENISPILQNDSNVPEEFSVLSRTVEQKGNDIISFNDYNHTLIQLHDFLSKIASAPDVHLAAYNAAIAFMQGTLKQDPITKLYNQAQKLPKPISTWLGEVATNSLQAIFNDAMPVIENHWENSILPEYSNKIANFYPVAAKATIDLPLADFAHFFAPGGTFDKFYRADLASFISTDTRPWKLKAPLGASLSISDKTLHEIERAINIRDYYFNSASKKAEIDLNVKPRILSSNASSITLTLGNQSFSYSHGPQRSEFWHWPSTGSSQDAGFSFTDFNSASPARNFEGLWGLFRMLRASKLHSTATEEVYYFTARAGDNSAIFRITTTAPLDALTLKWLQGFYLPEKL